MLSISGTLICFRLFNTVNQKQKKKYQLNKVGLSLKKVYDHFGGIKKNNLCVAIVSDCLSHICSTKVHRLV